MAAEEFQKSGGYGGLPPMNQLVTIHQLVLMICFDESLCDSSLGGKPPQTPRVHVKPPRCIWLWPL